MKADIVFRLVAMGLLLLGATAPIARSHYIFSWATETRDPESAWYAPGKMGRDVLTVFDVSSPGSPDFGKLVAFLPVDGEAMMAHHTNYELPKNNVFYANDWMANQTYVFDVNDPQHPKLVRSVSSVGKYAYPHSFLALSNGNTLATFQYSGGFNKAPGGIVEFDASGNVIRTSSAADPLDPNIRPYSLAVSEKLNRVVTGSADMMGAQSSRVVQVWQLSDLRLIKTIVLPQPPYHGPDSPTDSTEPRTLSDGETIVVPTFHCGLFLIEGLSGNAPSARHIYDFGGRSCQVPVVAGNYLVVPGQSEQMLFSLDMSDPAHPRVVSRLPLPAGEYPHWLSLEPNGDRIVIAGYGELTTKLRFATIDRQTGELTLDVESIDFTRAWPDGWNGAAVPHGSLFSNDES
jgi:hypothetical protein